MARQPKRNSRNKTVRHAAEGRRVELHTCAYWLSLGVLTAGIGAALGAGQGVASASTDAAGASGGETSTSASKEDAKGAASTTGSASTSPRKKSTASASSAETSANSSPKTSSTKTSSTKISPPKATSSTKSTPSSPSTSTGTTPSAATDVPSGAATTGTSSARTVKSATSGSPGSSGPSPTTANPAAAGSPATADPAAVATGTSASPVSKSLTAAAPAATGDVDADQISGASVAIEGLAEGGALTSASAGATTPFDGITVGTVVKILDSYGISVPRLDADLLATAVSDPALRSMALDGEMPNWWGTVRRWAAGIEEQLPAVAKVSTTPAPAAAVTTTTATATVAATAAPQSAPAPITVGTVITDVLNWYGKPMFGHTQPLPANPTLGTIVDVLNAHGLGVSGVDPRLLATPVTELDPAVLATPVPSDMQTLWATVQLQVSRQDALEAAASESASATTELLWESDFTSVEDTLDYWSVQTGRWGTGAGEYQYYTYGQNNVSLDGNGNLVIQVRQETPPDGLGAPYNYTSARLATYGLATVEPPVRIVARMKLPSTTGTLPAFWTVGLEPGHEFDWPRQGEIDIVEYPGLGGDEIKKYWTGNLIGPSPDDNTVPLRLEDTYINTGVDLSQDFHDYGIDWYPDHITWTVDGVAVSTISKEQYEAMGGDWTPFSGAWPHYLILTNAVGNYWVGSPDSTSVFPQDMLVDWVRVYSLTTDV